MFSDVILQYLESNVSWFLVWLLKNFSLPLHSNIIVYIHTIKETVHHSYELYSLRWRLTSDCLLRFYIHLTQSLQYTVNQ